MGKKLELKGQRFGRLLVIEKSGKKWKVKCDCGAEKVVIGNCLLRGSTRSCGCYRKEKLRNSFKSDIKGQRFGRLLTLEDVGTDKHGNILWECICDCGKKLTVAGNSLRTGHTKSCGCYSIEIVSERQKSRKRDLTGLTFGRLSVLKEVDRNEYNHISWLCKCSCGSEKIILGNSLMKGDTLSCGCYSKEKLTERMSGKAHYNYKGGLSKTKEYKKKSGANLQLKDDPGHVFSQLKGRVKRKKGVLEITKEEWRDWYLNQLRICVYCNRPIGRVSGKGTVPSGISIDRKDNDEGYFIENCVLCCYKCNTVKNDIFTYEEMKEIGQKYLKPKWQSTAKKGDC